MHGIRNTSSAADVQDLADIHEGGKDRKDMWWQAEEG
jgi:hypothetical protein